MARIRTIKPEFPQSESMGRVSRDARLLFVELWTICDDAGRTRAASRMLASLLFPYDDDAPALIDGWLKELEAEGCIVRYTIDGTTYLQVSKWLSHQKIDKPSPSRFPQFDEASRIVAKPRECSSEDLGPRTVDLGMDLGMDQGKGPVARKRAAPEDVEPQVWTDWVALRRGKRANVSQTAVEEARKEAAKAGVSFNAFLRIWCRRGSQGLEASWLKADEISAGRKDQSFAERSTAAKSARLAEMTGGLLGAPQRPSNVIDMEEGSAPLRIA
jgi:hypothetical protein